VLGVSLGLLAGYFGGRLDAVIMRVADVQLSFPAILIALLIDGVARIALPGDLHDALAIPVLVLAIGFAGWVQYARTVRGSTMVEKQKEYVQAARVFGSTGTRTSIRHLIPNLMTEVVVLGTSAVGWAVLTATTLSFLGLGVQLPQPDWGSDLAAGATYLATSWWLPTFPGLAITVTILAANFIGDYLMTVLDPREGVRFGQTFATMALGRRAGRARALTGAGQ